MVLLAMGLQAALRSRDSFRKKWEIASQNIMAYEGQYSNSQNQNRVFKLTIEQLKSSKDSIFQVLNETKKELRIKDSKLQGMQYISSDFTKIDTIRLQGDTIFRDVKTNVDTLICDKWYSVGIKLQYPSTMIVKPKFLSEKHIVVSARRETVNPPKKFFLWRWLQKKHTVLTVDVVEKNPYVQNQVNRYVEIVR